MRISAHTSRLHYVIPLVENFSTPCVRGGRNTLSISIPLDARWLYRVAVHVLEAPPEGYPLTYSVG